MKSMTIKGIPDEVLKKYRMYCLHQEKSVKQAIIDHMKEIGDRFEYQEQKQKKPRS